MQSANTAANLLRLPRILSLSREDQHWRVSVSCLIEGYLVFPGKNNSGGFLYHA